MQIAVLMSTYNGSNFIREQIDSIINQENVEVSLYIRDDGSTDGTIHILEEYQKQFEFVHYIRGKNLGPALSFLELIQMDIEAEYYALSDQDDIWLPDKLASAIEKLKYYNEPAMYYSALQLIDQNGTLLKDGQIIPDEINQHNVLYGFFVTGCTVVYNCMLADVLRKYKPKEFYMHDAWIACVAVFTGKTVLDKTAHIMYRQHANNVVGMKKKRKLRKKIDDFFRKNAHRHENLACNLLQGYAQYLEYNQKTELELMSCYRKSVKNWLALYTCSTVNKLPANLKKSCKRMIVFRTF
ncbi:MAG: glycosyltransferase family 2 protein [Eubacteriales bacterium]|nr:glycosyltransferase family 2 protein [Eubacteriales bacterium]